MTTLTTPERVVVERFRSLIAQSKEQGIGTRVSLGVYDALTLLSIIDCHEPREDPKSVPSIREDLSGRSCTLSGSHVIAYDGNGPYCKRCGLHLPGHLD